MSDNSTKLLITEEDAGSRLDIVLTKLLPELTRSNLKKIIELNQVKINNIIINSPSKKLKNNDNIEINLIPEQEIKIEPYKTKLNIVFEDKDILVINKPAGMVVHPGAGNYTETLVNALIYKYKKLSDLNGSTRPGIVHRIDKDTSGLLVVAKSDTAHAGLAKQFADHSISRRYLAVSKGVPQKSDPRLAGLRGVNFEDGGVIRVATNIARHKTDRKRMAVVQDAGRHAITRANVLENFGHSALLECWLETGRTHQIRVHFSHIGHGLIGDPIYGLRKAMPSSVFEPEDINIVKGFTRQALHAKSIGFLHPITNEYMNFDSDIPNDLNELIEILKKK